MAEWQSGYAAACKAVDIGSIPVSASNSQAGFNAGKLPARVAKLVDARDLKSLDPWVVPVRFRLRAPCRVYQPPPIRTRFCILWLFEQNGDHLPLVKSFSIRLSYHQNEVFVGHDDLMSPTAWV